MYNGDGRKLIRSRNRDYMQQAEPRSKDIRAVRTPSIWFRVLMPSGAIGPGKIDLLRLIVETGSVSAAARRLRMSHVRSVKLVAELNALGTKPLIETRAGGESGGGARLTPEGQAALERYDALDRAIANAAAPHLAELAELLLRE